MRSSSFRHRLVGGDALTGVFVKTPSHQSIELVALSGVDVAVVDVEHAPIGAPELDAMLAVAHALDLPCLVRVPEPSRPPIQQALDAGATGVVVPHVDSVELARSVARWSRYGPSGRGYSGSTRAAGWGVPPMADVLRSAAERTTVVVQVEDAAALECVDELIAVPGVDAVFVGVADLTVALGRDDPTDPDVETAVAAILGAARRADRPVATYASTLGDADVWRRRGVSFVCVGSDQSRLRLATG